jgi:hypothetical protein
MFQIGSVQPVDTATFRAGLARGLEALGVGAGAVLTEGEFPRFESIRVDLTGARFHRGLSMALPSEEKTPLCFARTVSITGKPVAIFSVPVNLSLEAQDVVLATATSESGPEKVLVLERTEQGRLELSAARAELEKALLEAGQVAARSKGAEVKRVDLELKNEGPRALAIRATITAKAMVFTTTVVVSGVVELDDHLNAQLRDLQCDSEGMVGKMAASALRPQFEKVQGKVIPLGRAVAGLALSDVTISGGDELRIRGEFRSAA